MVISIRRSRHDEGENWLRSGVARLMPLTISCQKSIEVELETLVSSFLPEAPLWVAVTEKDEPIAFMLLTGEHMDALFVDPMVAAAASVITD